MWIQAGADTALCGATQGASRTLGCPLGSAHSTARGCSQGAVHIDMRRGWVWPHLPPAPLHAAGTPCASLLSLVGVAPDSPRVSGTGRPHPFCRPITAHSATVLGHSAYFQGGGEGRVPVRFGAEEGATQGKTPTSGTIALKVVCWALPHDPFRGSVPTCSVGGGLLPPSLHPCVGGQSCVGLPSFISFVSFFLI